MLHVDPILFFGYSTCYVVEVKRLYKSLSIDGIQPCKGFFWGYNYRKPLYCETNAVVSGFPIDFLWDLSIEPSWAIPFAELLNVPICSEPFSAMFFSLQSALVVSLIVWNLGSAMGHCQPMEWGWMRYPSDKPIPSDLNLPLKSGISCGFGSYFPTTLR